MKNKIRILNDLFSINFVDEIKDENNNNLYGKISYENFEIEISKKYSNIKQLETLLHEIFHGLDDANELELKEKQITVLARVFLRFALDNREKMKELLQEIIESEGW